MYLPYGESNFRKIALGNYYYIDKTTYIEKLENSDEAYIFFLRPRRFGKSLFVSMLEYYYGIQYKDEFEAMFGNLHVGKNPTQQAHSFLILKFDFSGIETDSYTTTEAGFLKKVKNGFKELISNYPKLFNNEDRKKIDNESSANGCATTFFELISEYEINTPIYLLIDEYDHFANDLLAYRYDDFTKSTGSGGFVRTFYEVLKTATNSGIIQRIFITGVTPITLDSLTSGFNICGYRTTDLALNDMIGFTEGEVEYLLTQVAKDRGFADFHFSAILENLRKWYNGYLFNIRAKKRIYNADMLLYFASEYAKNNFEFYPDNIVDENVTSDYLKIQSLFDLKDRKGNYEALNELLRDKSIMAKLKTSFNLNFPFTRDDFVSLLFYMGFISIKESVFSQIRFSPPNYIIETLFFEYFMQLMRKYSTFDIENQKIGDIVLQLAQDNNIQPLVELAEKTLQSTSNRDFIKFDEKHIKLLFIAYVHAAGFYYIKSEPEIDRVYPDLMLLYRPPYYPNHQFLFEFKYVKTDSTPQAIEAKRKEATGQLLHYANTPETKDFIGEDGGGMKTVKGYIVVFCGDKAAIVEEIQLF